MSKNVYILGFGDFGCELMQWVHQAGVPSEWHLKGYLDDTATDVAVVGRISDWQPQADDAFLMGIAAPKAKQKVYAALKAKGGVFLSYAHPSAVVASTASLAEGSVLCPGALVSHNASLGACVLLNAYATVGHDVVVGAFSTFSCHVDVTGHVQVGEGVFIGSHACIIPSQRIGDFSVIGAGAVVIKKVEAGTTVFGNPARKIGSVEPTSDRH